MANGFGTLFIGVSGLQSSQNALNTTANNLANVDTTGYVRQQVLFTDRNYVTFNETTAVSKQQSGLGVYIGDVIHSRDVFALTARSRDGRHSMRQLMRRPTRSRLIFRRWRDRLSRMHWKISGPLFRNCTRRRMTA